MANVEELSAQLEAANQQLQEANQRFQDANQRLEDADREIQELKRHQDRADKLETDVLTLQETVNSLTGREADLRKELEEAVKIKPPTVKEDKKDTLTPARQPRTVIVTRERKLQKLSGRPKQDSDPEVGDWIADVRQHIVDLEETQKLDTVMGFLAGDAKAEVRLYPESERNTADKILTIIAVLYKDVDDLATLNKKFYERLQKKDESLQSYSLALLKLREKILKKAPNSVDDTALRTRFVEGVKDEGTKRDLRRLARDNATLSFTDFRRLVLEWMPEDDSNVQQKVTVKALTVDSLAQMHEQLAKSVESLQQQQQQLIASFQGLTPKPTSKKVGDSLKSSHEQPDAAAESVVQPSSYDGVKRPYKCWKCGKPGHIAKYHRDDYKPSKGKKSSESSSQTAEN